jgi:hypothetical protein
MDLETFNGSDLHPLDSKTTEELIAFAFNSAQELLGLDQTKTYLDRVNILRLFDNLAKMLGGDDKLMRHWMESKNVHLGYVPVDHAHDPLYLEEINAYLEAILHN